MEKYNDTLYFGGTFKYVGKYTGSCIGIDRTSGTVIDQAQWPKSNGRVNAIISDGSGGIIIAGDFTRVGDSLRNNIAQINASGQVTAFKANVNAEIKTVLLQNGIVYFGGQFTTVNGIARSLLASIDLATSNLTSWTPNASGYIVNALETDGTNLYVGGDLYSFNSTTRTDLAAFNLSTGNLTPLNIAISGPFSAYINTLLVHNNRLYVGGEFSSFGGNTRNNVAALDLSTGTVTGWNPNSNFYVYAMTARNDTIYIGGNFTQIGGASRYHIASVSGTSGSATSWDPHVGYPGNVLSIAVSGNSAYIGGYFDVVGSQYRSNFAAIDITTSQVTSINPKTYHYFADVSALYVNGNALYLGGKFASIGGEERQSFAAIDMKNNKLLPLNLYFDFSAQIKTIKIDSGLLYLGGRFGSFGYGLNTVYRNYVASFDINNQYAPTSFNPLAGVTMSSSYDDIRSIEITPAYYYLSGKFSFTSGSTTYKNVVRINRTTGLLDTWQPSFQYNPGLSDFAVNTMLPFGNRLYMGGAFGTPSNQYIGNFMYYNFTSNANVYFLYNGAVNDIKKIGNRFFVGGNFTNIGTISRNGLAAIDTSATAGVFKWNPNLDGGVTAIGYYRDKIYIGGYFSKVGNQTRNGFAVIDTVKGGAWPWNPSFGISQVRSWTTASTSGTPIRQILPAGDTVFVAGDFDELSGKNITGLARFHFDNYQLPNVKITASSNPVCDRDAVALNATSNVSFVNYEWKVNGVFASVGNMYNYVPTSGDIVSVRTVVAGAGCYVRDTAVDTIIIQIEPRQLPSIVITGPAKQVNGWDVTINAAVVNAGNGYTIDWKNNGVTFNSTTTPTVTYSKGAGTDNITATVRPTAGCYDAAVSNTLVIQENVGIEDITSSNGILIYPNPVTDIINIKGLEAGDIVALIDITGRKIFSWNATGKEQQYPVSQLQKGHYILKINNSQGILKTSKPVQK